MKEEKQTCRKKNDEKAKTFFKDGSLESKCKYKNGKRVGNAIWYYPNGNIKQKAPYNSEVLHGVVKTYLRVVKQKIFIIWDTLLCATQNRFNSIFFLFL